MSSLGQLVAVGRTSDVYEFGTGAVVKVPRPSVPAHWAAQEARFTAAVRELGAPAPAVLDLVEVEGRDAVVFELVEGQSMWDRILEAPGQAPTMGGVLASVHEQILSAGLPADIEALVDRMAAKLESATQLSVEERTTAKQVLGRLPRGAALLHGDLHPGNVLMGAHGPVVIDWFDAAVGHPVGDVVRSSVLIRPLDGAVEKPHLPGARPEVLHELHDAYVTEMSAVLGRSVEELRHWEAVVAASRLAEDAEADESKLLDIWRGREGPWRGPLAAACSGAAVDE